MSEFNTQREILVALMVGDTLEYKRNSHRLLYKMIDDTVCVLQRSGEWRACSTMIYGEYGFFERVTKPNWYDNIPADGIICWVHDDHQPIGFGSLTVVYKYVEGTNYPFSCSFGIRRKYATPLNINDKRILR